MNKKSSDEIWSAALAHLETTISKTTFLAHLRDTKPVSFDSYTLTISTRKASSIPWLENERLHKPIVEAVRAVSGDNTAVLFTLDTNKNPAPRSDAKVKVIGVYSSKRSEIIKPDRVVVFTQYFRTQWMHRLGPILTLVVIDLRQRCFWNHETGEKRDTVVCTYDDLAHAIGVSTDRIYYAFRTECRECDHPHPVADHFIKRMHVYQDSRRFGKRVRVGTMFKVELEDPLTPTDVKKISDST